jgi:hypothetical protein
MKICKKCGKEFPNRITINKVIHNISKRQYCLDCSPFKQHNTRQLELPAVKTKVCLLCHQDLPISSFYKRKQRRTHHVYCKRCFSNYTSQRQQRLKQKCVSYKGGKCEICGYDKHTAALDFHHKIPGKKDFNISQIASRSFSKTIRKELDKCMLLCANCHREIHATY